MSAQVITRPSGDGFSMISEKKFRPTAITFQSGSKMLTSLSDDIANTLMADSQKSGKGRIEIKADGSMELIDSLWVEYGDTHTDLHDINDLLRIKDRIISLCGNHMECYESLVIVDWGCGAGHTLVQLDRWLQDEKIAGVQLYGFANEIHPDWQHAPENITFILDVADHLPKYFKNRTVDFIYSIAGLYYLFLPDTGSHDYDMVEYFSQHQFNGQLFKSYAHTEKHLEQLSFIMKFEGELIIDLPIHVIDIDYQLLETRNDNFMAIRDPMKYGEHAYVVVPNISVAAE